MLGSNFVREGVKGFNSGNAVLDFVVHEGLPEAVDAVEILAFSLVGAGTYNYVVEKRAERKAKEMIEAQKAEEAKTEEKAEDEKVEKAEGEVVDKKGKPVK